tara:strand:+ start:791 stop:1039 length:249 start_codon:yes stop_codon:yes gene_type:complete
MKAILLEVAHLHFPPYIKDLLDGGIEVVGFWVKSEKIRAKYSKLFRCDRHKNWEKLLMRRNYSIRKVTISCVKFKAYPIKHA